MSGVRLRKSRSGEVRGVHGCAGFGVSDGSGVCGFSGVWSRTFVRLVVWFTRCSYHGCGVDLRRGLHRDFVGEDCGIQVIAWRGKCEDGGRVVERLFSKSECVLDVPFEGKFQ
jgi:hypothetical protein